MTTAVLVFLIVLLGLVFIAGAVVAARQREAEERVTRVALLPDRVTEEDRRFLAESWRQVEGIYPHDPAVALEVAHRSIASVFRSRGMDPSRLPGGGVATGQQSDDEIWQQLLQYELLVEEMTGVDRR